MPGDPRIRALLAAQGLAELFGVESPLELPALTNVGALALALDADRVELRFSAMAAASARAVGPDVGESLLGLDEAALYSAFDPSSPLFGKTSSLGTYVLGDHRFWVGLEYPDGILVDGSINDPRALEGGDLPRLEAWAQEAAAFAAGARYLEETGQLNGTRKRDRARWTVTRF